MSYTIRQGLDVAKEYSTAKALRALPDGTIIFTIELEGHAFVYRKRNSKKWEWAGCHADSYHSDATPGFVASYIGNADPRPDFFTIAIPEAE